MAKSVYTKNIKRTIFGSMGRYMAILAIIALGVGFFVGVKNTKDSMITTCDKYVDEYALFDYRLISTYGFTGEDVAALNDVDEVASAEGAVSFDFFSADKANNSIILRAQSITDSINKLDIVKGRMPEKANECVVDDHFFTYDYIGKTLKVTDENNSDIKDEFTYDEYKIVGITKSPYYLMKTERGTTSLGDGNITAFVYMPLQSFTSEYFTEMFVTSKKQGFVYSEEYDKNIEAAEEPILEEAEERAAVRYDEIVGDTQKEIDEGKEELEEAKATLTREKSLVYGKLRDSLNTLNAKSSELSAGKAELAMNKNSLIAQKSQLEENLANINAALEAEPGNAELLSQKEVIIAGLEHVNSGLNVVASKEKEIAAGEAQIKKGYKEYYSGKAEAEKEFADAEAKIADGEKEIASAEEKLADLEAAEIYVQTREDNMGFTSFESNSAIVDSIAKVFPVFFFLIAALVCSTTMSRMIEEERTQLGALRALGYTNGKIMVKYMVYSGTAAVIGCIIGFLAGSKYFPLAIWIAYGMMFGFASLEFYFNGYLAVISLVVSLLCSMGTTYFACRGQLKSMPAEILRPRAPKAGKRVVLERVDFVWSRLKFLHKVTVRNILRYKKRMVMMIVGIGGCAALVLAGFGMDDSVAGISDHQYTDIEKYDMVVAFSEKVDDEKVGELTAVYGDDLINNARLQQTAVTIKTDKASKTSNMIISDDENITKAISFKSDGVKIPYPGRGEAVINNKMAEMLDVEKGDTVEVEYDDTNHVTLTVSDVYRNYISSYMFINEETFDEMFGETYVPTMAYLTFRDGIDVHKMAEKIDSIGDIMAISINEDFRVRIDKMMESLNYIIILVIACAGTLAFIVLFNLSNINITEREREIATINVLGFYPGETGAYVFRENLVLVVLGIMAGLPAGFILHKFIMKQINVDMVSFNEVIDPSSYVFTVITVLIFTLFVDRIMRKKLKKINMAEALKSIE